MNSDHNDDRNADHTGSRSNADADHDDGGKESQTLTVRVGSAERTRNEALERVRAAERGEDVDERHVLNVEDDADLARLVSETNLELLRVIAEHEPRSMRHVEEIVGRDHKEVHRNLTELEALGVVEFVEDGRAKRPRVRFDRLEITIPVRRDADRELGDRATDDATTTGDPTFIDETTADEESEPSSEGTHSEV